MLAAAEHNLNLSEVKVRTDFGGGRVLRSREFGQTFVCHYHNSIGNVEKAAARMAKLAVGFHATL